MSTDWAELGSAKVRFWVCPVREHRRPDQMVVTVEWRGDVAYCTYPDCHRSSADPGGAS